MEQHVKDELDCAMDFGFYLVHTLIPDLRESGRDATADDFQTCAEYLKKYCDSLKQN